MELSSGYLFLSLVIGAVGAGLFIYGKKQGRLPQMIGGFVLSVYPFFVPNLWAMAGIGVGIVLSVWLASLKGL